MNEKDIEARVVAYAKTKDFLAYKFTSPAYRSVPDRMFVTPKGNVFFIEFKAKGKKPTEGQSREIARLVAHRLTTYIIDDVAEGKMLIDHYVTFKYNSRLLTLATKHCDREHHDWQEILDAADYI